MEALNFEVDPVQYGRLLSKVEQLEAKVDKLESSIEELLRLANQGKGGIWAGIWIASMLSAFLSFATAWFLKK
jgi:hypothetical protein